MKYGYRKFNRNKADRHWERLSIDDVLQKLSNINRSIAEKMKSYRNSKSNKDMISILAEIDAIRNIYNELLIVHGKLKTGKRDIKIEKKLSEEASKKYFHKLLAKYKILP